MSYEIQKIGTSLARIIPASKTSRDIQNKDFFEELVMLTMKRFTELFAIALGATVVMIALIGQANAAIVTCGTPNTQLVVNSGVAGTCLFGSGNGPNNATEANTAFPGTGWSVLDEDTSAGTGGNLNIVLDSGSWGQYPLTGTWSVAAGLWDTNSSLILKAHIGNGGGDPDWFAVALTPGAYSGTWDFVDISRTGGGGLSNFFLFGQEGESRVPEPGPLGLLGLGLAMLAVSARRRRTA